MSTKNKTMYITQIKIEKVRHLKDIIIKVSEQENKTPKHLLITGKNGSGKTSVLDALAKYLDDVCRTNILDKSQKQLSDIRNKIDYAINHTGTTASQVNEMVETFNYWEQAVKDNYSGLSVTFNCEEPYLKEEYKLGNYILAYFKTERSFQSDAPKHVEKVVLKDRYAIEDEPGKDFIKYLVDKKVSQSLFQTKNEPEKAEKLNQWFVSFEKLLKNIFEDDTLQLDFDVNTFSFNILEKGRERFDFNTMSSGFAAILDIVVGIIMRMEQHTNGQFEFDMPGIVLVDEIETHLHYELQKKVLPFLCTIFPNIQFIVSTHSAFILNSIENAVIYDLENKVTVQNGLSDIPYDGIIEGYFDVSTLSKELQSKFERYKELVKKKNLTDEDFAEIKRLALYLEEIPDYLALDVTTEYRRLKLEFEHREDI